LKTGSATTEIKFLCSNSPFHRATFMTSTQEVKILTPMKKPV